jgi:hypothetical protein
MSTTVYVKTLSGEILSLLCEPTVVAVWHELNHYDSDQYPLHRTDIYPDKTEDQCSDLKPLFMVVVLPFSSVYFEKKAMSPDKSAIYYIINLTSRSFELYETSEMPESHRVDTIFRRILPDTIHVVYYTEDDRIQYVSLDHMFENYISCCTTHSYTTLDDVLDKCAHQFTKKDDTTYRAYRLTEEAKSSIKRFIRLHQ